MQNKKKVKRRMITVTIGIVFFAVFTNDIVSINNVFC